MMFSGLSRHSGMRVYSVASTSRTSSSGGRSALIITIAVRWTMTSETGKVAEAEDVVDVLGLAAFDPAMHGRFLHQPFDLGIGEDFVLRGFLDAEQAQNPA